MEHLQMGWIDETSKLFEANATIVAKPRGNRLFQVGDQLTWLSGWQEGAILTAKHAVKQIAELTRPA